MKYCYVVLLFFVCVLYAQASDTSWTRTFGGTSNDMGYSIQRTFDGGYIIAGWTASFGAGHHDVYLIKTDSLGDTLWTKTYGGTEWDEGWSVVQTSDGGYIVAGWTYSSGVVDYDVYLVKTDANGDTLWTRTYGGDSTDYGYSVQQTSDGGYIIAGKTLSFGLVDQAYLIKTDTLGDTLWTQTYGGSGHDAAYSVQQSMDGGYIIAGYTTSYGVGGEDVYVVRTDSNGDSLWSRTYGGLVHDLVSHIETTSDSGYIMAGYTDSFGASYGDFYLVKTDVNGDTLWTRHFGGWSTEWAYSAQETDDGDIVVAGWTDSYGGGFGCNIYLMKLNSFGDTLWTQTYGGDSSDAAFDLEMTSDGGYIMVGSTRSFGTGGEDVYLVKTAPDVDVAEESAIVRNPSCRATIFSGPLLLPDGKTCRIFDITGRVVAPARIRPGVYFIEIDGQITRKVVKVR